MVESRSLNVPLIDCLLLFAAQKKSTATTATNCSTVVADDLMLDKNACSCPDEDDERSSSSSSSSSSSLELERNLSACRSCQRPVSDSMRVESGSRVQSLVGGASSSFEAIKGPFALCYFIIHW